MALASNLSQLIKESLLVDMFPSVLSLPQLQSSFTSAEAVSVFLALFKKQKNKKNKIV